MEFKNCIISLTSYPARINTVHLTINSLLNQTVTCDKVVLWLAEEQFPNKENDLPKELLQLANKQFEIQWCNDIRSYKKLIPTLKKYPETIIITCDDDVIYDKDCVKLLYNAYKKDSKSIWCHRGHYILFDRNKNLKPYKKWFHCIDSNKPSFNILQTGVGAVLYPPSCFHIDVLKEDLFMNLSYDADDIWFWAMAVLNGTKVGIVKDNLATTNSYIENDNNALYLKNMDCGNDNVLKNILEHYPIIKQMLSKKNPIFIRQTTNQRKIYRFMGIKVSVKPKKKHKIIGYTAGAFDLFHIGHLNLLKRAKAKCDYLIVGVTTDELIQKTKKKTPVIPYVERVQILSELKCVDKVVEQNDLDKVLAWEKYHYNVLFSGDDWKTSERWQGYERELEKRGARVEYFPYTKTTSSTLVTNVLQQMEN